MYTPWDIYCKFREAQASFNNRGYRLPKDWNDFWDNKLNEEARQNLQTLADYFNTKWCDIDLNKYMDAGFETWKGFTYKNFLDRRVIKKYIRMDKAERLNSKGIKKDLIKDLKHIKNNYGDVQNYLQTTNKNDRRIFVDDYIKNNIKPTTIVFLMKYFNLELENNEKDLCPLVVYNYRDYIEQLRLIGKFINQLMQKI